VKTRRFWGVVLAVIALAAGLGVSALPASAQKRTLVVTLLGGDTVVVTVDVPRGTKLEDIEFPDIEQPIVGVSEPHPPKHHKKHHKHHGAHKGAKKKGKAGQNKGDGPKKATTTAPADVPESVATDDPVSPPANGDPAPKGGTPTTPTAPTTTTPPPPAKPEPTTPAAPDLGITAGDASPSEPDTPQAPPQNAHKKKTKPKVEHEGTDARTHKHKHKHKGEPTKENGGVPSPSDPTFSLAEPGAAPLGVPNFFIDRFRIPPFLLPIYQAAGIEYGVPWQVLAAINEIETDYGRNLNVSSAGAVGWMQFMPATWKRYGTDANSDEHKDPYNPVDAIFSSARYLRAAGAEKDLKRAIFAYNHADWYVESVLLRARLIGGLPADLVGSLTGLTQARFPVAARAKYAGGIDAKAVAAKRVAKGNAAVPVESDTHRRGIGIYTRKGAPVIAVQDGRILAVGRSQRLGRYVQLEDVYGNRYTYGHLGSTSRYYAAPKLAKPTARQAERELKSTLAPPKRDPKPTAAASAGAQKAVAAPAAKRAVRRRAAAPRTRVTKERLFAHPARPVPMRHGGRGQLDATPRFTTFKDYFTVPLKLKRSEFTLKRLKPGAQVIGGTILGRVGKTDPKLAPHLWFEIRPAGRGAPRIDPKPILDGWKLLEATAIYRAEGKNPFFGPDAKDPTIGQILLMGKEALQRRILADPNVQIYTCGRRDIQAGEIDRRVLATLEFLAASGLKPTVSSLHCGHSYLTKSGNVSEHSSGTATDIAAINGIPINGHQGKGSITDLTIRRLLTLQGTMKPHQIISLMTYRGADNTMSLPDHADHIHVGFRPLLGSDKKLGRQVARILKPGQWVRLIDRLNQIPNPTVRVGPSKYSIKVRGRHSPGD
jgi:murein DD-endopeptidase MepM/ murein hydrolase activator NlpD